MAAPLLLTDKLPLRRASDLPNYRTDAADKLLPWVFGRATLAPVPLDLVGAEWLVADHPCNADFAVAAQINAILFAEEGRDALDERR